MTPLAQQLDLILRGIVEVIQQSELESKLARSIKETVPFASRPGSTQLRLIFTLGHTVLIHKLQAFPGPRASGDLPHRRFTGMIGDPTGRSETRVALSEGKGAGECRRRMSARSSKS